MPTVVSTITQTTTPATHLVRDVSTALSNLASARFPLDTLLRRMKKGEAAKQVKKEWAAVTELPRKDTVVSCAGGAGSVTLNVTHGSYWRKNDIILPIDAGLEFSNKRLLVLSVTSDALTVRALDAAGYGTVPVLAAASVIAWVGNSLDEGGTNSSSRFPMPDYDYNYTELMDTTVSISKTRKATANYTENDWKRAQRTQLTEFRKSIESKCFIGDRTVTVDATTSEIRWTMGGTRKYITKRYTFDKDVTDVPTITESQLIDWVSDAFGGTNGSPTRFLFADKYLLREIAKTDLANLKNRQEEVVLGLKLSKIITDFGTVFFVYEPLFNELGLDYYGQILDLEAISKCDLRPMERITLELDKNGTDKVAEQYIEQSTIMVEHADCHAEIVGN